MNRTIGLAVVLTLFVALLGGAVAARGAAPGVQVSVLASFPADQGPAAVAATSAGDVVTLAGTHVVALNPNGQQHELTTIAGGAFGIPIGIAYDKNHQLYVAQPGSFGPPAQGTVFTVSPNGNRVTPVPGSEGMVAPDGFGLDSGTGDLYVTDIYGMSIWRISNGHAQMWTSLAQNPLLVLPDGVKIYNGAAYVSIEGGKILRIPINANGTAGAAQVWAHMNGSVFFDDMVLDDRTGNVYVTRLDTNELLQITPGGTITPIVTNADGLLGAANMSLIHVGQNTVIYLANGNSDFLGTGETGTLGPSVLKITISG